MAIIAKNEEDNLKLSLPRLYWCDDVVVVDDFSTDATAAVAANFGARVLQRRFDGFGTQKQYAVAQAKHRWVLNIDADEVLSDQLIEELKTLSIPEGTEAVEIPVRHVFMGREFKHGKESRFYHTRLFNREKANFDSASVHEKVIFTGVPFKLQGVVLHHSYRDLQHYFSKFNTYTGAGALRLKQKGQSRSLPACIAFFPVYFLKHYVLYGNFMNGAPGFVWSYLNAWYHTVKYLKLYELNRHE